MQKDKELIPKDLVQDYAEIGVDALIEDAKQYLPLLTEIGEDAPIVKTIIAAITMPRTFSDALLGHKVKAFLYNANLNQKKIKKLEKKFTKVKQERLWERVVFAINAHDDKVKSEILGKLFGALMNDFITLSEFFTLAHATNSLDVYSLDDLKDRYSLKSQRSLSTGQLYNFANLGLLDIDDSLVGSLGGGAASHPLNQMGWKYVGIVYGFPPSGIGGVKIGEGLLVSALKGGQMSDQAFPLAYLKSQQLGLMYREVDLFEVTANGKVLVDQSNLPLAVVSEAVPAGDTPSGLSLRVAGSYTHRPLGISVRKVPEDKVQKHTYIVKIDQPRSGCRYLAPLDIRSALATHQTGYGNYLSQILDEVLRHTEGELKNVWDAS